MASNRAKVDENLNVICTPSKMDSQFLISLMDEKVSSNRQRHLRDRPFFVPVAVIAVRTGQMGPI